MFRVFSAASGTVSVMLTSAVPVLRSFYPKAAARATEVRGWMNTRKRTEITIETRRILTIKSRSRYRLAWCEQCRKRTQMITPEEAAILSTMSSRAIYLLIEAGELHFMETRDGLVFICLNSLPADTCA